MTSGIVFNIPEYLLPLFGCANADDMETVLPAVEHAAILEGGNLRYANNGRGYFYPSGDAGVSAGCHNICVTFSKTANIPRTVFLE